MMFQTGEVTEYRNPMLSNDRLANLFNAVALMVAHDYNHEAAIDTAFELEAAILARLKAGK